LVEVGEGVYKAKGAGDDAPLFLLSTEISSIYSQKGKTHRIHTMIFAPSFEVVEKINKELTLRGVNLLSDGRPIMGLSAEAVAEIVLTVDERCLVIPNHVWTPWFSLYGSMSGFDSIDECFGDLSPYIHAVETGLSSDPAMNWRIEELSGRSIVSFSDAHSPQKLGREATVFELPEVSFENVRRAIVGKGGPRIAYTIEFYPEEGKYHYTGHRKCEVVYSPKETRKRGTTCPVCGKSLTVGVMSRVESLASREIEITTEKDDFGVQWISDKKGKRPPYFMLVPLLEIIAESLGVGVGTKTTVGVYDQLINSFESEFKVLLKTPIKKLQRVVEPKIVEGIRRVRSGDIVIEPGYDGVFGKVKIWPSSEALAKRDRKEDQMQLF
jgi:uncharacterized protein (TIGR00375 family)